MQKPDAGLSNCTCGLMPVRNLPETKPPAPGAGSYGWKHGNDFPEGISGGRRPSNSIWPNRQEICKDSFTAWQDRLTLYNTALWEACMHSCVWVCLWVSEWERDFASQSIMCQTSTDPRRNCVTDDFLGLSVAQVKTKMCFSLIIHVPQDIGPGDGLRTNLKNAHWPQHTTV